MVDRIIAYKNQVEEFKNHGMDRQSIDKSSLCRLLVMANIAEMVIHANSKLQEHERTYFEGDYFVDRYYGDRGAAWIVEGYRAITGYIKNNHW